MDIQLIEEKKGYPARFACLFFNEKNWALELIWEAFLP